MRCKEFNRFEFIVFLLLDRLPYWLRNPLCLLFIHSGRRIIGFSPFPRILALCWMQIASSRIWNWFSVHFLRWYQLHFNFLFLYLYYHPQTDCFIVSQLFSVARHAGRLKLGSKPAQLYVRLSIMPLSQQVNHVSSGIIRHYVVVFVCLHFCLSRYQRAQFIQRALHYASGSGKFLRQSVQPQCVCVCVCVCQIASKGDSFGSL